jgi:hypothetical protein
MKLLEERQIAVEHSLHAIFDELLLVYKLGQLRVVARNLQETATCEHVVARFDNFRVLGLLEDHLLSVIKALGFEWDEHFVAVSM